MNFPQPTTGISVYHEIGAAASLDGIPYWNSSLVWAHFVRISFSMKFLSIHCSGFPIWIETLLSIFNCINLLGLFKNRTNVQSNLQGEVLQVAKLDRRHKRKDSPRIGVGLCDHQLAVSFVSTLTHEEDDFPSKGGPK